LFGSRRAAAEISASAEDSARLERCFSAAKSTHASKFRDS